MSSLLISVRNLTKIYTNPVLLLADEPTGNLDTRTSIEVMSILQRLNTERNLTVLLVTHEMDIAEHGTRIITVRDGRVMSDSPVTRRRYAATELENLPSDAEEPEFEPGELVGAM